MATVKFSGPIGLGAHEDVPMTNLALAGFLHVGEIRLGLIEPDSTEEVLIYAAARPRDGGEFRQVGDTLRVTNTGKSAAHVTIFEE